MLGCLGGGDPPCEKAVNTVQRANLRGVDVKGRPERRGWWPQLLGTVVWEGRRRAAIARMRCKDRREWDKERRVISGRERPALREEEVLERRASLALLLKR